MDVSADAPPAVALAVTSASPAMTGVPPVVHDVDAGDGGALPVLAAAAVAAPTPTTPVAADGGGVEETSPPELLFTFPARARGSVQMTSDERARLRPRQYLNDSVVDFHVRWVARYVVPRRLAPRCHFFNSFFFQ